MTTLVFGTDHGGFNLKNQLIVWLQSQPTAPQIIDKGAFQLDMQDNYPEFGLPVARLVGETADEEGVDQDPSVIGVLLCRSGAGMAMLANRWHGVRAAVCRNEEDARLTRAKNNANVVVLEGDHCSLATAQQILQVFMSTPFDGGRHTTRLQAFANLGSAPDAL